MLQEEAKTLYQKHKKIIEYKSYYFSYNKEQYQNVLSDANLIFMNCFYNYNETKGSFATYLSRSLDFKLRSKKNKKQEEISIDEIILPDKRQENSFFLWKENLSNNSQTIIELIQKGEKDIHSIKTNKIIKQRIREYLNKQSWSVKQIDNCFSEIKLSLKEIEK